MINPSISKVIAFLRYPLIILVVFIHVPRIIGGGGVYDYISILMSGQISGIAVPSFFMISGFLFFENGFNRKTYLSKLKKRLYTLLIPYLIWNAVYILVVVVPNLTHFNYTVGNVIACFWDCHYSFIHSSSHSPMDFPLWYVRDLMCCTLISLLLYWGIKRTKIMIPLVFIALWIMDLSNPVVGLSFIALAFFSLGGYFKLFFSNTDLNQHSWGMIVFSVFVALCAAYPVFDLPYLGRIITLLGVVTVPFFANKIVNKYPRFAQSIMKLGVTCFFIFAAHMFFLKQVYWAIRRIDALPELLVYCATIVITIFACHLLYYIGGKLLPKTWAIINGERANYK